MAKNQLVAIYYKGVEIGKIGWDDDKNTSSFQYHPDFLKDENFKNLFPYIFRKTKYIQVFDQFSGDTFRGLPPMIADSLPDSFGNIVFQTWWSQNKSYNLSALEQLTYVANRGMGALEFHPIKKTEELDSLDLDAIAEIAQQIIVNKSLIEQESLNEEALFNIFKIGTSAGGARPKVLVSEHKESGKLIPGDINFSTEYRHLIVKLDTEIDYPKNKIEYLYYKLAITAGINIMPSFLIADKYFATERFDRLNGEKQHILSVSGLTGWDFTKAEHSTYENIFKLALDLKVPHKDIQELFRRMLFNICFANFDDHLKNFSFIFNDKENTWNLSPAYDITFPGNPLLTYKRLNHACSVQGKRHSFTWKDMEIIAELFSIKNPKSILNDIENTQESFKQKAVELGIAEFVIKGIESKFVFFN